MSRKKLLMDEIELALAVSARPWADRLHRHTLDHGGARVRVRVIDRREALDQEYGVLFIDDTCSFLDRRLVDELAARGKGVVAVVEGDQAAEARDWVARLGVTEVITGDSSPEDFIARALGAVRSRPRVNSGSGEETGGPTDPTGRLVAVMGCSGGVGATEIAIATASAWKGEAILVDLDVVSPSIAQRLGLRPCPTCGRPSRPVARWSISSTVSSTRCLAVSACCPAWPPRPAGGRSVGWR